MSANSKRLRVGYVTQDVNFKEHLYSAYPNDLH
jgi:hypothetical protein